MKTFSNLIITFIISFWIIILPIFAIQNVAPISLTFFGFQSISIPLGILVSFSVSSGFIGGALLPVFFSPMNKKKRLKNDKRRKSENFVRDWELEEEDDDPIFDW
ncbi:MAG: lipopolysaccharide assembly protein LapA domain-containing protein [Cyanobacterium sp.]